MVSATGEWFDRLAGEWQLANNLQGRLDLAALTEGTRGRRVVVQHAGPGAGFGLRLTEPGGEPPLPAAVAPYTIVLRLR